jgi:hypothetical protein
MSKGLHGFKYSEARRMIRVGRDAGFRHPVLEVDPASGRMTIRDGDDGKASGGEAIKQTNPWDEVLTNDDQDKERPA